MAAGMAAGMASMASSMIDAAFFSSQDNTGNDPADIDLDPTKPVWVLGNMYQADEELDKLNEEFKSKFWFTYRRNFPLIGDSGQYTDTGWGCMLRCGQMMLAQALLCHHLGREWKWESCSNNDDESQNDGFVKYMNILRLFLDRKASVYSIHNIAEMGVGEGKSIGEWFGPNTVSQVIRKLVCFNGESEFAVHVAMDNTVVIEDIKTLCRSKRGQWGSENPTGEEETGETLLSDSNEPKSDEATDMEGTDQNLLSDSNEPKSDEATDMEGTDQNLLSDSNEPKCDEATDVEGTDQNLLLSDSNTDGSLGDSNKPKWHPLLLFIPLRLGLVEINSDYYTSLKAMFTLKQSLGVIGGKPNHAHYFIGFNGDRLLFLDPHTTQENIEEFDDDNNIPDETYHCSAPSLIDFSALDPSLALGFYCETEEVFDEWTFAVKDLVISREKRPMFEITDSRPSHWPPFELPKMSSQGGQGGSSSKADMDVLTYDYGVETQVFDSSGEYEII